jgi:hypothetical protein
VPLTGGPDHYAAYLTNIDGFEVELVASETCSARYRTHRLLTTAP